MYQTLDLFYCPRRRYLGPAIFPVSLLDLSSDCRELVLDLLLHRDGLVSLDSVGRSSRSNLGRKGEVQDRIGQGESFVGIQTEVEWQALASEHSRQLLNIPLPQKTRFPRRRSGRRQL